MFILLHLACMWSPSSCAFSNLCTRGNAPGAFSFFLIGKAPCWVIFSLALNFSFVWPGGHLPRIYTCDCILAAASFPCVCTTEGVYSLCPGQTCLEQGLNILFLHLKKLTKDHTLCVVFFLYFPIYFVHLEVDFKCIQFYMAFFACMLMQVFNLLFYNKYYVWNLSAISKFSIIYKYIITYWSALY